MLRPSLSALRVRLAYATRPKPNYRCLTDMELAELGRAQNRFVNKPLARLITGFRAFGARAAWTTVRQPDRDIPVRVLRPRRTRETVLPLVLHVHGGGYTGTAVQSDWLTSHLATRLPAVVVSVEHRLVSPETTMSAAVDDVFGALSGIRAAASQWGIDADRVALVGESAGAAMTVLAAQRDPRLLPRAQVLVNPCLDLTDTALGYQSMKKHPHTPTVSVAEFERFRRLAAPAAAEAHAVSPLSYERRGPVPSTLLVIPALDPLADHARTYAAQLRDTKNPVEVVEFPRSGHAFLNMPHLDASARPARQAVLTFLAEALHALDGHSELERQTRKAVE